jgi:hypothetical protein
MKVYEGDRHFVGQNLTKPRRQLVLANKGSTPETLRWAHVYWNMQC